MTHRPSESGQAGVWAAFYVGLFALVFAVLLFLVRPALANADYAYTNVCANDPGPIDPSITNDAAIEVHYLERQEAADCLATTERLEAIRSDAGVYQSSSTDQLDLAWWGVWAVVGLVLGLFVAPMFQRAFRFWSDA